MSRIAVPARPHFEQRFISGSTERPFWFAPQDPGDEQVVDRFLSDYLEAWERRAQVQVQEMVEIGAAPEEAVRKRYEESIAYVTGFLKASDMPEHAERRPNEFVPLSSLSSRIASCLSWLGLGCYSIPWNLSSGWFS